jgi:hypothetical protein
LFWQLAISVILISVMYRLINPARLKLLLKFLKLASEQLLRPSIEPKITPDYSYDKARFYGTARRNLFSK